MKAPRGRDYGATMARLCWDFIMGPLSSLTWALCCSLLRVCLPFSFFFYLHITSANLFSTSFFILFLSVCIFFEKESPRPTKLQSISLSVRLLPLLFHLSPGLHLWGGQKKYPRSYRYPYNMYNIYHMNKMKRSSGLWGRLQMGSEHSFFT